MTLQAWRAPAFARSPFMCEISADQGMFDVHAWTKLLRGSCFHGAAARAQNTPAARDAGRTSMPGMFIRIFLPHTRRTLSRPSLGEQRFVCQRSLHPSRPDRGQLTD